MLDLPYSLYNLLPRPRKMSQDKDLAISKNLAEHHTRMLDALDKINELWLLIDDQRRSFEKFKAYMEAQSKGNIQCND